MGCNTSKESVQQAVDDAKEDAKDAINAAKDTVNELINGEAKNGDVPKSAETVAADDSNPEQKEVKEEEEESEETDRRKEEEAATRIQAVFRGHKTRKSMRETDSAKQNAETAEPTKEELEQEFREDDPDLLGAAVKIQSTFRGYMSRKVDQAAGAAKELADNAAQKIDEKVTDAVNELEGIDLSDPDLHKAATKIQASFRGHKVRQEVPVPGTEEKK